MVTLGSLKNTTRPRKNVKRVGRGLGSGLGKLVDAEKKALALVPAISADTHMKAASLECL